MNWFWLNLSSFVLYSFCLAFLCSMNQRDFDILWMSRLRLIETGKFIGCRDRDSSRLRNFLDVETETHWDWKISWMSRPRLIENEKFLGCWDWDSSRLGNLMDVETETTRDWTKDVDTETPSRLSLISESSLGGWLWVSAVATRITNFYHMADVLMIFAWCLDKQNSKLERTDTQKSI